jgi:fatty acid desaturase
MTDDTRRERLAFTDFHQFAYIALGAAVLLFALSVWGFGGDGYTDYLLIIVSGFIILAAVLPAILWHVGKKNDSRDAHHEHEAARSSRDRSATGRHQSSSRLRGDCGGQTQPSRHCYRLQSRR